MMYQHKSRLKGLTDEIPSGTPTLQCQYCPYQTVNKPNLEGHLLLHKNSEELLTTHQRNDPSPSPRNGVLGRHISTRGDPSEEALHDCNFCPFQTHNESALQAHMLCHEDPFQYDSYVFEEEHTKSTHVNSLKGRMFQCGSCEFETKYKRALKLHELIHKDASEVTMYQCQACPFQTKHKGVLKIHVVIHKDPAELTMYRCDLCPFQSKRNYGLRAHMLTHMNSSEIVMYHCESCPFQTKLKRNLRSHTLIHKDPAEVTMHQCELCPFQTKYRTCLRRHALVHKDSSEVTMYRCASCSFQTKHKGYLKKHKESHVKGAGGSIE